MSAKPPPIRVLFADADAVVCISVRRALHQLGNFIVTIAYDGVDLLGRFEHEAFDVVVADAALGGRDGHEILRQVKLRNPSIPVILLSADTSVSMEAQVKSEGAFAFLPTPQGDIRQLAGTIGRAVEELRLSSQDKAAVQTAEWLKEAQGMPPKPPSMPTLAGGSIGMADAECLVAVREMIASASYLAFAESAQLLLEKCARLFGAKRAAMFRMQDTQALQLYRSLGFTDQTEAARDLMQHVGDAFAWSVVSQNETQISTMPSADGTTQVPQCVGTPILLRTQVVGALVVYDMPPQTISTERITWFELFAAQGGLASQVERLRGENEHLVPNDPLTGILKRNVFLDLADHEFRRSWRYNQPIAALVVDIDEMQEINSSHGREFGDQALHAVAKACRNIVRSIDLVGRYDDDSVAILLLMTDRSGSKNAAERLRVGIASLKLPGEISDLRVTVTLGVAPYPRESCSSIYDLLNIAQQAQRAAHRSGRNQTMVV